MSSVCLGSMMVAVCRMISSVCLGGMMVAMCDVMSSACLRPMKATASTRSVRQSCDRQPAYGVWE